MHAYYSPADGGKKIAFHIVLWIIYECDSNSIHILPALMLGIQLSQVMKSKFLKEQNNSEILLVLNVVDRGCFVVYEHGGFFYCFLYCCNERAMSIGS